MATDDCLLVTRAAALAARRHVGQMWKHAADREPAICHLADVALLIAEAPRGAPVIAAAWLHDSVGDEVATLDEIARDFGPDVSRMVADCTDDMGMSKAERWQRQIDGTPHKSADVRALKIADKISNLRAIAVLGSQAFEDAKAYLPFAVAVSASCRNISPRLDAAFDDVAERVRAIIVNSSR